jgi:hypothetical protein
LIGAHAIAGSPGLDEFLMIPQEQRRKALVMTLVSLGLLAGGIAIGLYWVSIYAPK